MVESPKSTLGGVGSGVGWSSGGCRCGRCAREGEVEHLHGSRPGWGSVLGGLLHLGECSCALLAWIPGFAHVLLEKHMRSMRVLDLGFGSYHASDLSVLEVQVT